jgi:hypothetical protein
MSLMNIAFTLGVPGYIVMQLGTLVVARYEGWRAAFAAPLFLAVPIAAWCLLGFAQGSNLWPLPFLLFAPVGCLYLMVVLSARALIPSRSAT